jgi:hypothetical protein
MRRQPFPRLKAGSENCFGIWDSNGLPSDMRNVIHHSQLISTSIQRGGLRRNRKSVSPSLASLGSRVGGLAQEFPNRAGRAECSPSSRSLRPTVEAGTNGQRHNAISSRSLEQAWLKQHHTEYAGAWVALEGARLVARAASAKQALDDARSAGFEQPLIVHIPSNPELPFGGW